MAESRFLELQGGDDGDDGDSPRALAILLAQALVKGLASPLTAKRSKGSKASKSGRLERTRTASRCSPAPPTSPS
eukprot:4316228-Prymnesium_polylepis.1